jgi:hypothetical protein
MAWLMLACYMEQLWQECRPVQQLLGVGCLEQPPWGHQVHSTRIKE